MSKLRRYWPILALLVVPLVAIGKAVFTSQTIGAYDQIAQMEPWNGPKPEQPYDVLQADSVLQFYPWRSMVFEAWGKGQMPFWNPYQLCGTPLLANSQSGGFYPPHILMGVLHVPVGTAIDLLAWFHLFIAGCGVYACVRRFGGTELGGLVGGISFSLSSFMLAWAALPSVISTCAWIPWVFWGIASLLLPVSVIPPLREGPRVGGDAFTAVGDAQSNVERSTPSTPNPSFKGGEYTRSSILVLAFSTAMMLLAGHLQFAAYGLIGTFVLGVVLLIQGAKAKQRSMWRGALFSALAVSAGGLLAMPQLKPVLEYSQFSHRKVDKATEEGYKAYLGLAMTPNDLMQRVATPFSQGDPTTPKDDGSGISTFEPAVTKPGANFAESAMTIAPVALIGLLLAFAFGRLKNYLSLLLVALLGALLMLGTPLNQVLYFYFPGWASTGSPGRSMVLFVLGLCVIGGIGIRTPKKIEAPVLRSPLMGWIVVVATLAGVFQIAHIVRSSEAPSSEVEWARGMERHAFENERWAFVVAAPAIMPPNTASIYHVYDVAGYDSLLHRDTVKMLHEIDGRDSAPEANGNIMFVKPGASLEKLGEAGVSKLHRRNPQTGVLEEVAIPTKGRAFSERGPAVIRNDGYDRQTVFAAGPGRLIVKDRKMDGWSATVDGKPVPVDGDRWRELQIDGPEGGHQIEFRYEPPGLKTGLGMAGVGILLLLGTTWLGSRAKKDVENGQKPL